VGLIWLFQEFKDSRTADVPQLLSDHPNDRIGSPRWNGMQ
jgi:hypothetical protein